MSDYVKTLQEPVRSKILLFLDKRILRLENRDRDNKTALGRLKDLKQLIEGNLAITNPPKFIIRKIEELS